MSSQLQVSGEAKIRDIQGPVVANSGVITALDGDASQYVRGDGTLADFPTSTGGGSSVSYYLNSSVSQGTIGGVAYRQLGKTPIAGAGTDIVISSNGYVASYLTDANDPALLEVPAGNFNCEFYFSVNNNTGNPFVYAEVYKYDGTTFTLIGTSVGVPEYITEGTVINPYYFAVPVAQSVLTVTDRIAIRIYVNVDGRTVTLHTENNHLCQVVTTFSKGLISLNNLTRQNQFFATGTSGTDFGISSSVATHTFNLPVASAANTGKLSSTDWSTFNGKQPAGNYVTLDTTQTITAAKTFTGVVSSIADTNAAAYILQGRTSDDLAQIQFKNNAGTNTKAKISVYSVGTNGGGMQFLVKPDGLPEVSSLSLSSNQADFETSVTSTGIFRGTTLGILNSTFTSTIGATLTANRTITIPDLSGTLALLEGTQTFTGDKLFNGTVDFNNSVDINSGLFIRNNVIGSTLYTSFTITKASSTQTLSYLFSTGFASNLLFNDAANYSYTFPTASGTIALTSNLSSYVPYTGATTDLNLGIYSLFANAVNTSSVDINVPSGGAAINFYISSVQKAAISAGSTTLTFSAKNTGGFTFQNPSNTTIFSIDNTGITTLTDALNGTSATFSNNISVSGVTIGKGRQAGTGTSNIGIGFAALGANTTGINNLAIGSGTLYNNTTGDNNISLGYNTLEYNTTGSNNIALGLNTLGDNTTGGNNIGIGIQALEKSTTADGNIGIGYGALGLNTTGVYNTAIGYVAGSAITTGSYNTIIGRYVGTTTINSNIILADGAGNIRYQWNGTNNVFGNPISGTSATFSSSVNAGSLSRIGDVFIGGRSGTYASYTDGVFGDNLHLGATASGGAVYINTALSRNLIINPVGGNVGIGNSNASNKLSILANGSTSTGADSSAGFVIYGDTEGSWMSARKTSATPSEGQFGADSIGTFLTSLTNHPIVFRPANTERMRITSGGNVLINNTANTLGGRLGVELNDNGYTISALKQGTFGAAILARVDNTNSDYVRFFYSSSNTQTGSINTNGTTTTYNVTSDYRLKQDLKDYKGLDLISAIKTYDYEWKSDKTRMYGVLAHELQEILPYAVTGEKDAERMQSVDYSKLTPVNTKAIQELYELVKQQQAQIEELSNKIVALQSK